MSDTIETKPEIDMAVTVFENNSWGVVVEYEMPPRENGQLPIRFRFGVVASFVDDFVETMSRFQPPVEVDKNNVEIYFNRGVLSGGIKSIALFSSFEGLPSKPPVEQ